MQTKSSILFRLYFFTYLSLLHQDIRAFLYELMLESDKGCS